MDDHSKTAKLDEIVKAITYFYQILTTIGYLPASATKLRQQEGGPKATAKCFAN
jgi:hypothetical protein